MKRDERRSFFYKAYKILCKMLKCDAIVYDVPSKKSRNMCICAVVDGMKIPLSECDEGLNVHSSLYRDKFVLIKLRNCESMKEDTQKAIVKKIMKVVKRSHVVRDDVHFWECPFIKKGTSFEELVVEWDLRNEIDA